MRPLIIIAFLFLLVACSPVEQAEMSGPVKPSIAQEIIEEQETTQEPAVEEAIVEEEEWYERPPEPEPTLAGFLQYFKQNTNNYKFTYHGDQWTVSGRNARIDLQRPLRNQYHAPFIDTIYLDLERKTAVGVCEGRTSQNIRRQCASQHTLGTKYAVPFLQFKIKLPEEWLFEFQNKYAAVAETPRLVTDRPTIHLKHVIETRIIDFYIDPTSGLPLVVIDDGVQHAYENLRRNAIQPGEQATPA
jgi:hypothetical protein